MGGVSRWPLRTNDEPFGSNTQAQPQRNMFDQTYELKAESLMVIIKLKTIFTLQPSILDFNNMIWRIYLVKI